MQAVPVHHDLFPRRASVLRELEVAALPFRRGQGVSGGAVELELERERGPHGRGGVLVQAVGVKEVDGVDGGVVEGDEDFGGVVNGW